MDPSPSVRRFDARLRLYVDLRRAVRGFDLSDVILLVSLAFIFVGLAAPSAAFGVVGALLLPMTPIWTNVQQLIRGR
jgi:TRAP-type mannitol/chloroaromatic compound transport system permease large subunit